jgi:glutamate synthase domain-containing protein 1
VVGPCKHEALERKLYVVRKKIERAVSRSGMSGKKSFYVVSLSGTRIVYKGMLTSDQTEVLLSRFVSSNLTSAIALVHSRFQYQYIPYLGSGPALQAVGP